MDARSSANRQGLPPALPAKVRRNRYAGGSSSSSSLDMDTEGSPRSPLSPPLALTLHEEPSLPTDCHTHSFHSSSSQWQERIRADATTDRPPPLPRKLFRARSLPVMAAQRQSPHPPRPPHPCDGSARGDPPAVPTPGCPDQHSPCRPDNKAKKGNIILRGSYSTPSSPLCPPSEPVLSLTSLNFDTPDYMLPYYFKDLSSQEQVSWTIQHRHLLFLLETAQRLEAELVGSPLEERQQEAGSNEREAGSLRPEDFTLCEGRQPRCQIGGAVYYAVRCATVPGKVFAAKVYKPLPGSTAELAGLMSVPPHANIRRVFTHFSQRPAGAKDPRPEEPQARADMDPEPPPEGESSTVDQQAAGEPSVAEPRFTELQFLQPPPEGSMQQQQQLKEHSQGALPKSFNADMNQHLGRSPADSPSTAQQPPHSPPEGSTATVAPAEAAEALADGTQPTAHRQEGPVFLSPLLEATGRTASIEGAVPQGTLAGFVQEGQGLHAQRPDVYERRLCLLLLQLSEGLAHLRQHRAGPPLLRPDRLLLAWGGEGGRGTRGAPQRDGDGRNPGADGRTESSRGRREEEEGRRGGTPGEGEEDGSIHGLWERRGAPRLLISDLSPSDSDSVELQLGLLIYHCLHLPAPHPGTSQGEGLPPAPQASPYSGGLLRLARRLLAPQSGGPAPVDARGPLRLLLWGPRAQLFRQDRAGPRLVPGWLAAKRALLLLRLAEQGPPGARPLGWEDCLCLRYLAHCRTEEVLCSAALLGLLPPAGE